MKIQVIILVNTVPLFSLHDKVMVVYGDALGFV